MRNLQFTQLQIIASLEDTVYPLSSGQSCVNYDDFRRSFRESREAACGQGGGPAKFITIKLTGYFVTQRIWNVAV